MIKVNHVHITIKNDSYSLLIVELLKIHVKKIKSVVFIDKNLKLIYIKKDLTKMQGLSYKNNVVFIRLS